MLTPLARARGLGSARDGTEHFWHQRLTAVANAVLMTIFVLILVSHVGATYEEMRGLIAQPPVALLFLAMVVSGAVQMRLGMQVIIEDYVHGGGAKLACLMANTFFSVAVGLGAAFAILKISFGG
jgi:succinate dehydrogenase / fumarate reductase membrane anchor subunit